MCAARLNLPCESDDPCESNVQKKKIHSVLRQPERTSSQPLKMTNPNNPFGFSLIGSCTSCYTGSKRGWYGHHQYGFEYELPKDTDTVHNAWYLATNLGNRRGRKKGRLWRCPTFIYLAIDSTRSPIADLWAEQSMSILFESSYVHTCGLAVVGYAPDTGERVPLSQSPHSGKRAISTDSSWLR